MESVFLNCEVIAGVLSDVALIGIGIFWDFLIHCWRIGNVRCDDMMGVMTSFEDDLGGHNPPWWPNLHLAHVVYGSKAILLMWLFHVCSETFIWCGSI